MNLETKGKLLAIREDEYRLLAKIAFLISDNNMAKENPEFKYEMHINIEKNNKEIAALVDQWERKK
jgi:hypothetical protein